MPMPTCMLKGLFRFVLVFAALTLAMLASPRSELVSANAVFLHGNLITVDKNRPRAQALALLNGRILAVGTDAQIKTLVGKYTKVVDLRGKTIVPGFIDVHAHPDSIFPEGSPYRTVPLQPAHVQNMAELIAALKKQAQLVPKGHWVFGERYDDVKLGRHPTRADLDQASTDHPISISHVSGHIAVVNSYVLEKGAITKETKDPSGGAFDRLPDGTPNGVCRESARVPKSIAPRFEPSHEQSLEGLKLCFENFLAKGITSTADAGASPEHYRDYQELRSAGSPMRVNVMMMDAHVAILKTLGLSGPVVSDH